jgi:hypothetical protein
MEHSAAGRGRWKSSRLGQIEGCIQRGDIKAAVERALAEAGREDSDQ